MEIWKKIARLIDVKSLVTLAMVAVLCVMTLKGQPTSDLFNSSIMLILGFFFGKKLDGGEGAKEAEGAEGVDRGKRTEGEEGSNGNQA